MDRKKALKIIPAIIDNEASSEEQAAFFDFIEIDDFVKKEYENTLRIKQLFKQKYKRAKAPEHLSHRINTIISALNEGDISDDSNIYPLKQQPQATKRSPHESKSQGFKKSTILRYFTAAAVVLFITLVTMQLLDSTGSYEERIAELIVENVAAEHFLNANGQLIEPHFGTHSLSEAEAYLSAHFELTMTVPQITGAQFEGIVMADFIDGFQTPLLEYTQPEIGETIYLFAFDVSKVHEKGGLKMLENAVEACNSHHDFYVAEINNHHVVSWLWDNTWYSAISNHNGYDLASLVEPLQYSR
ncbi:MAG: hypothetical protein EA391_06135 [Balneolaceae bacterium]|nr:MAG: hypothetical protein EA391_06135 [Balneolaceae bacterium]